MVDVITLSSCLHDTMLDQVRALSSSIKLLLVLVISGWSLYYIGFLEVSADEKSERVLFVGDFLESEADGDFDGEPIASLCSAKNWTESLIFNCDAPTGGIGVVRNVHLNCIRSAIEAGGQSDGKTILGLTATFSRVDHSRDRASRR